MKKVMQEEEVTTEEPKDVRIGRRGRIKDDKELGLKRVGNFLGVRSNWVRVLRKKECRLRLDFVQKPLFH